ncbi:MAG: archease, partial [Syntrophaceae bacterium]|nr:archease [Syntrophaceae bacterium]
MKKYELFDHTADIGIEFFGRTKKELFTNAIVALKDIMIEENEIKPLQGHGKKVAVEGADTADLL